MDIAASEFATEDGKYDLDFKTKNNDGKQKLSSDELASLYKEFARDYPIITMEDTFDQVRCQFDLWSKSLTFFPG